MVWGGGGVRVCTDIDIKHHFTPHHQISQTGPEVSASRHAGRSPSSADSHAVEGHFPQKTGKAALEPGLRSVVFCF